MNNPKALKIVIALLVVALFTSFGFLAYAIHQSHEWKYVVWLQDGRIAAYRALGDFRAGNLRLFIISGERGHDVFSGTNDGPFQVWFRQYGTQSYSPSLRYSIEDEIRDYNHEMRNLQQHPEKLLGLTNVMTP
jgi:hypothetical protein